MPSLNLEWIITDDFGGDDPRALKVKLKGLPYKAYIKWDGCCEVTKTFNEDTEIEEDVMLHICDIGQFITILQSLEDFRMTNIEGAE